MTRLESKPKLRKFCTFDFEWYAGNIAKKKGKPDYTFRYGSIFNGRDYHEIIVPETSTAAQAIDLGMREFLWCALQKKYHNHYFFAHWGGIADHIYLIWALHRWAKEDQENRSVSLAMNASSASIITVSLRTKRQKYKWRFVDSSFLFRVGLAKLAKWLGTKKGGEDETTWETEDEGKLRQYCKDDSLILYRGIKRFRDLIFREFGATLGMTMASTAINVIRRRYLTRDIATPERENEFARGAYAASRVEIYRFFMKLGFRFDVNSSFPFAMTFPLPGSPVARHHGFLPTCGRPYIAEVDIEVPPCWLPPLPWRSPKDFRVFFPVGRWKGTYTKIDIELALAHGCIVHGVGKSIVYEERTDLADYAHDVYRLRQEAKKLRTTDDPTYEEVAWKLIHNSAYGKFAEGEEKDEFLFFPESTVCDEHWNLETRECIRHGRLDCEECDAACSCLTQYSPGIWRRKVRREIQHRHVQIPAYITAIGRRTLFLGQVENQHSLHMSDTDCLHLSETWDSPRVGKKLGDFKPEGACSNMHYIASKVYSGDDERGDPILRAKGFAVGKMVLSADKTRDIYTREAIKRYVNAVDGVPIDVSHMVRAKAYMLSIGMPYDTTIKKALGLTLRPKRCPVDGTNETRPWTIEELTSAVPYTHSIAEVARRRYVVDDLRARMLSRFNDNALST